MVKSLRGREKHESGYGLFTGVRMQKSQACIELLGDHITSITRRLCAVSADCFFFLRAACMFVR